MSEICLKKPVADEFLITVLGGASEGESIVVHLGDNHWMIIDSCKVGDDVLPLKYLVDLGVSCDLVEYVVCTHWHADHVKGLGMILDKCENAKFVIPILSQSEIMPSYFAMKIYKQDLSSLDYKTVSEEYRYCMNLANKRNKIEYKLKDSNIFTGRVCGNRVSVDVLSPSNNMYNKYQRLWASKEGKCRFLESGIDPNKASLAIGISVDEALFFLLGADLECNRPSSDPNFENCDEKCNIRGRSGWCNVCTDSSIYSFHEKYDFVKIIHHSSKTGYCPAFWERKVKDSVIGVSTVFCKDRLPQNDMRVYYWDGCKDYYITAPPIAYQSSKGNTVIEKLQKQGVLSDVKVIPKTYGFVTSVYNIKRLAYVGTIIGGTAYKFEKRHFYKYTKE